MDRPTVPQWRLAFALLLFLLLAPDARGQSVGLSALFQPCLRLQGAYQGPSALGNGRSMGLGQAQAGLILPLAGKATLRLDRLEAKASQHFLLATAGVRRVSGSLFREPAPLYQFALGASGVKASLGGGLWAYLVQAGFLMPSGDAGGPQPFGLAGLLNIRIKGLHRQNFFGVGLVYANRRVLPVPLVGFRRKVAERLHATVILPVQADLTYRKGDWQVALQANWGGFSSDVPAPNLRNVGGDDWRMQVASAKAGLVGMVKLHRNWRLLAEAGLQLWQRTRLNRPGGFDLEFQQTALPYARVGLRINLGHSLLGSQAFGIDG